MTILEKCKKFGIGTGSRVICPEHKINDVTDYDFVMTERDFYRAFTDEEIDWFEKDGPSSSSVKFGAMKGYTYDEEYKTIDIILVKDKEELKAWEGATKVCCLIHKTTSLEVKKLRIEVFTKIRQVYTDTLLAERF